MCNPEQFVSEYTGMSASHFIQYGARYRAGHLFKIAAGLIAAILVCSQAKAQNLYFSDGASGWARNLGSIYKITPDGTKSTFASGLSGPLGMAVDSAGNLLVAHSPGVGESTGGIWKYT